MLTTGGIPNRNVYVGVGYRKRFIEMCKLLAESVFGELQGLWGVS